MSFLVGFALGIAATVLFIWTLIHWAQGKERQEQERQQSACGHWSQPGPHCTRCGKRLEEARS